MSFSASLGEGDMECHGCIDSCASGYGSVGDVLFPQLFGLFLVGQFRSSLVGALHHLYRFGNDGAFFHSASARMGNQAARWVGGYAQCLCLVDKSVAGHLPYFVPSASGRCVGSVFAHGYRILVYPDA